MRTHPNRAQSPGCREFLKRHASDIWACDFFCVRTVLFQTLRVIFVVRRANREIIHFEVTRHPTADWRAQQIVECCAWDRAPPRFLIHDGDSRYGVSFDRRVRHLGIWQVRTPFRSPRANAIAERWVRSARSECLARLFVFGEASLRRILSSYVTYYNLWRRHRSLGQRAPCAAAMAAPQKTCRKILAEYTSPGRCRDGDCTGFGSTDYAAGPLTRWDLTRGRRKCAASCCSERPPRT
jgi:putative transposase